MKKKTILILLVSALAVLFLGAGAWFFFTYRYYPPEAKIVKQLFDGLKAGLNQNDAKGYKVAFRQKYDLESKEIHDYGDIDFAVSYEGEGSVQLSFEQAGSGETSPRLTDLIRSGNGFIAGTQKEKLKYYNQEDHKKDEDDRIDDIEYEMDHEFEVRTDSRDCYVSSKSAYIDRKDASNDYQDSFYGKIGKEVLLKDASEERLTKRLSELLFMDAWTYIREFSELSNRYFQELDLSNAKAVEEFIRKHQITTEERNNTVLVRFVLKAYRSPSGTSGEAEENVPDIYGTMEIERNTGNVLHFEYDFGQYLLASLMREGEGKAYYKADVREFIIEGQVLNTTLEDLPVNQKFREFGEEDKAEFIREFSRRIIPFYEEEG